jgi:minor extracellular serine protease Vpr
MKFHFTICFILFNCIQVFAQQRLSNPGKLCLNPRTSKDLLLNQNAYTHALLLVNEKITDSALQANCISINSKFGNIWSVRLPIESLELLNSIPGIEYAEIAVRSNAARLKNDVERQTTSVDKVQNGTQNGLPLDYSGKDVVVGIVDIGFQCNNPTFYTNDGSRTRIKRYWQQNNNSGTPPQGFSYGTEITDTSLVQLANDMDGPHGTHVAGIAAGSGFTTPGLQYRGMAPGADLVFVGIKYSNDTLGGSALGDYLLYNTTILEY